MAQERPNRLVEWIHLLREQAPIQRACLAEWWTACREEPWMFWQTPAVRYSTYAIAGLTIILSLNYAVGLVSPPLPESAQPGATTADYHVACVTPGCGHHFLIHRSFGFSRFPVRCPACEKRSGKRALRCLSESCNGRWVAPISLDGVLQCPDCGAAMR